MEATPDGPAGLLDGWILRDDLRITVSGDPPGCVVGDPVRGLSYAFGEREHFLLRQLHHPLSARELADRFRAKFGDDCSTADMEEFRAMLSGWHLLCSPGEAGGEIEAMLESARGSADDEEIVTGKAAEHLATPNRFHLFDPRPLLDFLTDLLTPFRQLFLLAVPVLVFLGVMIMIRHYNAYLDTIEAATNQFGFIGKLLLTTITVNFLAQFAVGICGTHFGLNVPSFGIFLEIGLIPRFNMQVVPGGPIPRRTRLWITSMTPMTRFASFGLGMLLWRMAPPSSNLSLLGGTISAMAIIGCVLFDANPLWRTHGAAFFSALLDVPDLRTRAQRMFWGTFRHQPPVLRRHGKAFRRLAIYGMLSVVFLYLAFAYVAWDAFDRLKENYNGAGVALWAGIVAYAAYSIWRVQRAGQDLAKKRAQKANPSPR